MVKWGVILKYRSIGSGVSPVEFNTEFDLHIFMKVGHSELILEMQVNVSKMSNTFDIWPFLVKWGSVLKKSVLTYISEKVGRGHLILGMEVNVT